MNDDFKKAFGQISVNLRKITTFGDEDMMRLLVESRNALKDIAHNYKKILEKEIPESIAGTINEYEQNVITSLNDQIDNLYKQSGINPDNVASKNYG